MNPKVGDSLIPVGSDLLGKLLTERGRALREMAATTMAQTKVSDLQLASRNLVDRVGFELERLAISPDDVEQAARAARNCLETNLIARYILASRENLLNWFALRGQEEADILSNILKLRVINKDDLADARSAIESRIQQLTLQREKHGISQAVRLPPWSRLASDYGLGNIYESYYSLFSKYVHPSTLNIFPQDGTLAQMATELFTTRSQLYAIDLTTRCLDALGIDDSVLSSGPWGRSGVTE